MHDGFASENNCSVFINEHFHLGLIHLSKLQCMLMWLDWKWMPCTSQMCSVLWSCFFIGNMSKMQNNVIFSYTSVFSSVKISLSSYIRYNYESCQLFSLLMLFCPCPLDSDMWFKSLDWGGCYIFAVFNKFLHQWWFHTLCRVQEAFSEVAVHLFPLKSVEILLLCVRLSEFFWKSHSACLYRKKKKQPLPYKDKSFLRETLASWCHIWGILISTLLYSFGGQNQVALLSLPNYLRNPWAA